MARVRSTFTPEQMATLSAIPVVAKVSDKTIRFTEGFKEDFYARYSKGERPDAIFRSAGVDPEMLGELRVQGFTQNLVRKAEEGGDFSDRRFTKHELAVLRSKVVSLAERLTRLEKAMGLEELPGKPFSRDPQGAQ